MYSRHVFRYLAVVSVLASACDSHGASRDAADQAADATAVLVDSPPPPPASVDAGPPPMMACSVAAPTCELPPSTCLDSNYLVYYTDGSCVADQCQYTTNLLYCPEGCVNGGCPGGFT
jgi:hypothetical protein